MKNQYNYEELVRSGKGELYPGNFPKLPSPPFLMFDRYVKITDQGGKYGKGEMIAELDIKPDLWFFSCHFYGDPVMPGCLGLDALWQMLGFYLGWAGGRGYGRALAAADVKFTGQILPTNKLVTYRMDIKRILKRQLYMGIADGTVEVDGKVIYTATDLKVGLFQKNTFEN